MGKTIKEIRFKGMNPAIAYTDFSAIYLSTLLFGAELEVCRIHELSHIWLQHQVRGASMIKKKAKVNFYLWNIVCDLEIAKYIYTKEHNFCILKPESIIKKGIVTEHLKDFKGEYAEDFYEELLLNEENSYSSLDAGGNIFSGEDPTEELDLESVKASAIDELKKHIENEEKVKAQDTLARSIKNFKPQKPSLTSEIDKIFGRNKVVRIDSYRRPSRIENSDYLLKGRTSRKKQSKITVYVDRSGSFSPDKTQAATDTMTKVLQKYRGKVTKDTVFFNNDLYYKDPGCGAGGTNYRAVFDDINVNGSEANIVITDDDSCERFEVKCKNNVLVIPIGCTRTSFAQKVGAKEVSIA